MNIFITFSKTSAYVQDSSEPSKHFTFTPHTLPDGTICYYISHSPWNSNFSTTFPQISGYESKKLSNWNSVGILLDAYYK